MLGHNMKSGIVAFAALIMLPAIARADWEPTRWGMSADEVRSVMPSASPQPIGEAFNAPGFAEQRTQTNVSYLYTRIDREARTYDVRMGFAGDKLKSVEFAMTNPSPRYCEDARSNLQRRFGTPASGGAGEGGRFDSWVGGSDLIVFLYRNEPAPRCTILYAPGRQPSTGWQDWKGSVPFTVGAR
jgi:hypothetical protein